MKRSFSIRTHKSGQRTGFRRRRSLRRAVDVGCDLRSELWDGPVRLRVSDLSAEGMWIETNLPLEVGDELLATFSPPGSCLRLHALCEVSRVGLWRRADDVLPSGMGVAFTDLSARDRARLARSLIGIPPPLPLEVRLRKAGKGFPAPELSCSGAVERVQPARRRRSRVATLPGVLDPMRAVGA